MLLKYACALAVILSLFLYGAQSLVAYARSIPNFSFGEVAEPFTDTTIFFVGDIMLGRRVERIIEEKGMNFPFEGMLDLLRAHDLTVGNFEGTSPLVHVPTKELTFQFSIRPEYLRNLKHVGFDVLSLANNHSYDHGRSGYEHTLEICTESSLLCAGDAYTVGTSSMSAITVGDTRIGFIFLHTLFHEPEAVEVMNALHELTQRTDVQIAYVHWGTEYELSHSGSQAVLARTLIDSGADAVIGHHPHVVQGVEIYNSRPIFYSLGNFVFDQYFNDDVMEGLAISMRIREYDIEYTLIPVTTLGTRSQPHIMEQKNAHVLINRVLQDVTESECVDTEGGVITVPRR